MVWMNQKHSANAASGSQTAPGDDIRDFPAETTAIVIVAQQVSAASRRVATSTAQGSERYATSVSPSVPTLRSHWDPAGAPRVEAAGVRAEGRGSRPCVARHRS